MVWGKGSLNWGRSFLVTRLFMKPSCPNDEFILARRVRLLLCSSCVQTHQGPVLLRERGRDWGARWKLNTLGSRLMQTCYHWNTCQQIVVETNTWSKTVNRPSESYRHSHTDPCLTSKCVYMFHTHTHTHTNDMKNVCEMTVIEINTHVKHLETG